MPADEILRILKPLKGKMVVARLESPPASTGVSYLVGELSAASITDDWCHVSIGRGEFHAVHVDAIGPNVTMIRSFRDIETDRKRKKRETKCFYLVNEYSIEATDAMEAAYLFHKETERYEVRFRERVSSRPEIIYIS